MSGFGNYLGATMGHGENENGNNNSIYGLSWVTNSNFPGRAALVGDDGKFVQLEMDTSAKDSTPFHIDSDLLGEVPGLTSDNSAYQEMQDKLHGTNTLNWESFTFSEMRAEKDSLNVDGIRNLRTAWTEHGDTLKTTSEDFKTTVNKEIKGNWSGDSAAAAEAASEQVTKTSIYDFTSASDAIADRLTVLKDSFTSIRDRFPDHADDQLIDDGKFDKADLDAKINDFNSRYHIDGDNRLRNNDDGYVSAPDVVKEMEKINRSITDYTTAVQLFRDNYNPTVVAVAQNFPNLPAPPNMKYGDPTGPGGDPTGPGGTSPFSPGGGGGGGSTPFDTSGLGTKPIDKDKFAIDPKDLTDPKNMTSPEDRTDTSENPLDGLTDPVKSAIDTATDAAKDALGQAMDAAKNAAGQNPLGEGLQGPPEGVLGLGPQGLGGAGAGKAAGAGGGVPLRGMPSGLPTTAPATTAPKVTAPAAAAGLGAGAGSPGAGAPAAGQRGDQNGKGHQVNKALRRKKNGKDVIGNSDASVPVVGAHDEQEQPESTPADQSEFRRRIPQRDGTWQPNSAVQPGPARPTRAPQFTQERPE